MGWQVEGPGPLLTKVLEQGTRLVCVTQPYMLNSTLLNLCSLLPGGVVVKLCDSQQLPGNNLERQFGHVIEMKWFLLLFCFRLLSEDSWLNKITDLAIKSLQL